METGEPYFTTPLSRTGKFYIVVIGANRALVLDDARGVQILDFRTGRVLEKVELSPWPARLYGQNPITWAKSNVFCCQNKWIVFTAWFRDIGVQGMFVYSLDDYQLVSHRYYNPGNLHHHLFSQSQDDPETIVAAGNRIVDVFAFKDGKLTLRNSFPIAICGDEGDELDLLVATGSHVYVNGWFDEDTGQRVNAYDIHTGKLVRRINVSHNTRDMAFRGSEILLEQHSTVVAFCVKEPEQL